MSLLLLAALLPAGPDDPQVARDKAPPKEWDRAAMNKAMPHRWDIGPLHVLAWEIKEDERPWRTTRCLVVKKLAEPTDAGERWVLGALYYDAKRKTWDTATLWITPDPEFKNPPAIWGYAFYRGRPSRAEVLDFLKERNWTFGTERHWAIIGDGPSRLSVTRLIDGGVCAETWRNVLGHAAPDLFASEPAVAPPPREVRPANP